MSLNRCETGFFSEYVGETGKNLRHLFDPWLGNPSVDAPVVVPVVALGYTHGTRVVECRYRGLVKCRTVALGGSPGRTGGTLDRTLRGTDRRY